MLDIINYFTLAGEDAETLRICFSILFPLLISVALGWLFVPRVLLLSRKKHLYDIPNYRKVHKMPVPRLGGVTFFPVLLMSFCLTVGVWVLMTLDSLEPNLNFYLARFVLLAVGMMALFLTGVTDDLIGVSYQAKFVVQILCALLFPISGLWINDLCGLFWLHEIPAWFGIPLTVFLVVYVMNAVNLIDGVDGLASGLSGISFFVLGTFAAISGQYYFCILSFGMFGVLIPFWFYNVFGNIEKGKKIFMGDTGSLTLGYLLSFLLVYMSKLDGFVNTHGILLIGLSSLLIPLMDIPRVMLVRVRQGRDPFTPDTNHIHHRLMRAGLSPRCTMALLLAVSVFLVVLTVLLLNMGLDPTFILFLCLTFDVSFHLVVNRYVSLKMEKVKPSV